MNKQKLGITPGFKDVKNEASFHLCEVKFVGSFVQYRRFGGLGQGRLSIQV